MNQRPTVKNSMRDPQERERVTEAIVGAVADAEGVSPLELQPLARVVDPDALNALFEGGGDVRLEFEYRGFSVRVSGDGQVTLEDGHPGR